MKWIHKFILKESYLQFKIQFLASISENYDGNPIKNFQDGFTLTKTNVSYFINVCWRYHVNLQTLVWFGEIMGCGLLSWNLVWLVGIVDWIMVLGVTFDLLELWFEYNLVVGAHDIISPTNSGFQM